MSVRDPRPVAVVVEEEGVARAISLKHVASLLYSYRCTLSCRHCLFNCSPRKPNVCATLEDGLEFLRQLHETDRVVHIAGGEAMMFWPELQRLCLAAQKQGIAPHFVETNATFAASPEIARDRLLALRDAGVRGLLISADPHHQQHCPPVRYRHCLEAATEVFGDRNVCSGRHALDELNAFRDISRDMDRLGDYVRGAAPCLVGRAGDELAGFFPDRPLDQLTDAMWHGGGGRVDCSVEFDPDAMWELHIDPYGNIQTCCGIVLGSAHRVRLPDLLQRGFLGSSPIIDAVHAGGPAALIPLAEARGYRRRDGYPQKCGLCWEVRKFLRPYFPDTLGPAEVYDRDPSV